MNGLRYWSLRHWQMKSSNDTKIPSTDTKMKRPTGRKNAIKHDFRSKTPTTR